MRTVFLASALAACAPTDSKPAPRVMRAVQLANVPVCATDVDVYNRLRETVMVRIYDGNEWIGEAFYGGGPSESIGTFSLESIRTVTFQFATCPPIPDVQRAINCNWDEARPYATVSATLVPFWARRASKQ